MSSRLLLLTMFIAGCTADGASSTGDDSDGHLDHPTCDPATQTCDAICQTADADGDGWSDEVEDAMGTSAMDSTDNPAVRDQLVFVVPHEAAAWPPAHDVETAAKLSRADVAILLDTTGSMDGTVHRLQPQLANLVSSLAGEVDDLAFGVAGVGDFPVADNANSDADVPFYLVHRVMSARTPAGLASLHASLTPRNIIRDGLGNWFSIMRGGDQPEQHWEALRQAATGIGITFPHPWGGTRSVPAFDPAMAFPVTPPAGEEIGTLGGLGFRSDSTPILMLITDTSAHVGGATAVSPISATRAVARTSLASLGARVAGIMAGGMLGQDDLTAIALDTGSKVAPTAWGTGTDRPANCPIGKCCVVAEDMYGSWPPPDPVNGECTLVFKADLYSVQVFTMVAQAVIAIARGAKFEIGAELRDDTSDDVDVAAAFVERVEALPDGACSGEAVTDRDGDGAPDAFTALVGGATACFRITPRSNTTVPSTERARRYRAVLQLTGDGVASFAAREVWFVVPSSACKATDPVLL